MAKKQTKLQEYLSRPLPSFNRGDADCCAWCAEWANIVIGEPVLKFPRITFGEVVRRLRARSLADHASDWLAPLGWTPISTDAPAEGAIIIIKHELALGGQVLAIYSDGTAIARTESTALLVVVSPTITHAWSHPSL